jgi:uncharacterized membrane protein
MRSERGVGPHSWWQERPEKWGVLALLFFTVTALLGYGVFGVKPERIPASLIGFWQISYQFFAQAHIWLGALALFWVLFQRAGTKWIPAGLAVCVLSFLAEHTGTGTGLPFGEYEYTHLLGARIGGRVPWVIPVSWFLMALPSWLLARATFPQAGRRIPRLVFAAVLLTLWDLSLDPAMSFQQPFYWRWADTGPYYGMPWINLAGWWVTGMLLMGAMELLGVERWGRNLSTGWALAYYAVTVLMPLGMVVIEGLWWAFVATILASALSWAVYRRWAPAPVDGAFGQMAAPSPGVRSAQEGV